MEFGHRPVTLKYACLTASPLMGLWKALSQSRREAELPQAYFKVTSLNYLMWVESLYPKPQSKCGSRDEVFCLSKLLNKIVTGICQECQIWLLKRTVARPGKYEGSPLYSMNYWPADSIYEILKVHSKIDHDWFSME